MFWETKPVEKQLRDEYPTKESYERKLARDPWYQLSEARTDEELSKAINALVQSDLYSHNADLVESLIIELTRGRSMLKGREIIEWYLCRRREDEYGHDFWSYIRAFLFVMDNRHCRDNWIFLETQINKAIKERPYLYWISRAYQKLMDWAFDDFERSIKSGNGKFSLYDWQRVERYIRRAVDSEDTFYLPKIRTYCANYDAGYLALKPEYSTDRFESGKIGAFLKTAYGALKEAAAKEESDALQFGLELKKRFGLTGSVVTTIEIPHLVPAFETNVEVIVPIRVKVEATEECDKSALALVLDKCFVSLRVDGGVFCTPHEQEKADLRGDLFSKELSGFVDGIVSRSFWSLGTRGRVRVTLSHGPSDYEITTIRYFRTEKRGSVKQS